MIERVGRILAALALGALASCSFNPKPKPPENPEPPKEQQCATTGQACGCWDHPPEAQGWLYACCQPGVPGGVVLVQDPAQCVGDNPPPDPPPPDPPPTGDVPPKGTPQGPEKLLRLEGNEFLKTNGGVRFDPFGVESCCQGWAKCPETTGSPLGTGWPGVSGCFMNETGKYGANLFHFRMGPWYATPDYENLWAPTGGAYNVDGSWNPAFWSKVRELVWDAYQKGRYVEVVPVDDWWLKGACGYDVSCGKQVPWPDADVKAWGKTPSPAAEALYRKTVAEVGCFGNVIWATGNEEDLIPGMTAEHVNWRISIMRDEEPKSGCGFVHLIGTGSGKGGINADYQITHERSPVTGPCNGRYCANNEHNPEFSPEQEAANFKTARDAGQRWDAWRADANDSDWEKRLDLFRQIAGGAAPPTGCFAPPADDPLWVDPPTPPSVRSAQMMEALNEAKARVGNRCGATAPCDHEPTPENPCAPPVHLGCLETNGLVAAELRKMGYCATGPWTDATAIIAPDGFTEEMHVCSTGDGCYTGNPYKNAWKYRGQLPTPGPTPPPADGCTNPEPLPVTKWNVKLHTEGPNWKTIDSTPLVCDRTYCERIGFTDGRSCCPIRQEGDPQRSACEAAVVGTPQWTGPPRGEVVPGNPYLYRVPVGVPGTVTVCTSVTPQVCGSMELTR